MFYPHQLWAFLALCVICFTAIRILSIVMKRSDRRTSDPDEVRAMQELNRGLGRMEERIGALETLLIDRSSRKSVARDWE